ncbi:MAG: HEPN domain-containing protein [Beijerinckiaceae bacterium]
MKPEAEDYLDKAHDDLDDARKIAGISLAKVAARSAYYAAFHAAEAFIIEHTGKVAKTHSGVRTEFARLLKDTPSVEKQLLKFLGQAYKYKEISDYAVGHGAVVTDEAAKHGEHETVARRRGVRPRVMQRCHAASESPCRQMTATVYEIADCGPVDPLPRGSESRLGNSAVRQTVTAIRGRAVSWTYDDLRGNHVAHGHFRLRELCGCHRRAARFSYVCRHRNRLFPSVRAYRPSV